MSMARRLVCAPGAARDAAALPDLAPALADVVADVRIALQPIISVPTGSVLAYEALARFADKANTEAAFRAAYADGWGPALEAQCVRAALRRRVDLPGAALLSVNVSPNALEFAETYNIWPDDLRGVVVEITEQEVNASVDLPAHLDLLRERGAAIAIDDVSTGYAGLLRLAQMAPDYVKVDRQVVTGVGDDVVRAAVLEALVTLSHRLGAAVIGEGVEGLADLAALSEHDVDYAQGFGIARPAARTAAIPVGIVGACRANRRRVLRGATASGREVARTRDVYAVTAALASAGHRHDIDAAIVATARDLGVDNIGVSILSGTLCLREIASTELLDTDSYSLARYPATAAVLNGAGPIEIQLADHDADPAERALMRRLGFASMLLVAVLHAGRAIGVVEFAHRTPRRWTAQDVAHARGLAEHLSPVLRRLGVGAAPARLAAEVGAHTTAV
jgi:EAL domain-containing protein (putative c-di-GMP-specific phosphodiesterase class I)